MYLPILAGLAVIILYIIFTFNKFQALKTQIEASIQEIGNQLKRQASLIPNLESSAKGYLKHEKAIFDSLTRARVAVQSAVTSGSNEAMERAQKEINNLLPKLSIVVESNPQIQASAVVKQLMDELRDTADKLTYARRTMIDVVADFNQMLISFPTNLIGNFMKLHKHAGLATKTNGKHLEVSDEETESPKINL
jgi:LemA protein